jgi:hypothetical protein
MTITYTQDAQARMIERGISQQEVEATMKILFGKYTPTMDVLNRKVSLNEAVPSNYFELSAKAMSLCWSSL